MKLEKGMMEENKHEIVVQDACILIDLIDLDLIDLFFQMNFSVFTTLQVVNEITLDTQKAKINIFLDNGQLQIDSTGTIEDTFELFAKHPALSIADSSVLELAIRKEAIIFSSDGSLRKISVKKGLTVRGSLWIIEELFNRKIITTEIALKKLELYKFVNRRAPFKQIENLITKLISH